MKRDWRFYGRTEDLSQLSEILKRDRWFFARISGRRRIGKTRLVQEASKAESALKKFFYVQIPDSEPTGVLTAFREGLKTFDLPHDPPQSLFEMSLCIGKLVREGFVVTLDEFQYFNRKVLSDFNSHLQAVVDELSADSNVRGGLLVLGSIHSDMVALLEDRNSPLYNRTTNNLEVVHLDIASILEILREHCPQADARHLLFLWSLFEGVPKFYRDCFEQGVLEAPRKELIRQMFFSSSSPLRNEAENWFLSELRGRYDAVLKYVAQHPGCTNADIKAHLANDAQQVGGYLKNLSKRYQMIEQRQPIFAKTGSRKGRYYLRDNFLRSWLSSLQSVTSASHFRPEALLLDKADQALMTNEGHSFERIVKTLYEERSRKEVGDFGFTRQLNGYWDKSGTELDFIAINDDDRILRIGTCKRNPKKLISDLRKYDAHIERLLEIKKDLQEYRLEKVALAPLLNKSERQEIGSQGYIAQDLAELVEGL